MNTSELREVDFVFTRHRLIMDNACRQYIDVFDKFFPNGVTITRQVVEQYGKYFDLSWLALDMLGDCDECDAWEDKAYFIQERFYPMRGAICDKNRPDGVPLPRDQFYTLSAEIDELENEALIPLFVETFNL